MCYGEWDIIVKSYCIISTSYLLQVQLVVTLYGLIIDDCCMGWDYVYKFGLSLPSELVFLILSVVANLVNMFS